MNMKKKNYRVEYVNIDGDREFFWCKAFNVDEAEEAFDFEVPDARMIENVVEVYEVGDEGAGVIK